MRGKFAGIGNKQDPVADASIILRQNFGVDLEKRRDINRVLALTDPAEAISRRDAAIEKLFVKGSETGAKDPTLPAYFSGMYTELVAAGYPPATATDMAMELAQNAYNDRVAMLDATEFPGVRKLALKVGESMTEARGLPATKRKENAATKKLLLEAKKI
jgi:hypothetical protein